MQLPDPMLLANLGPVGSPGFLLALWFLCAGVEALVYELGVRPHGLPRKRVLELALLLNLLSWPLFVLALVGLRALGLDFTLGFLCCEAAVVLAESWGFVALLRQGLPAELSPQLPTLRQALPISLAANLVSIGIGLLVSMFV